MDTTTITAASIFFTVLAGVVAFYTMGSSSSKVSFNGKTVLITGGSEGMGLAAAKQMAGKGANVILVARGVDKLQSALEEVQSAASNPNSQRFHYISADISVHSYATPLLIEASAWNGGKTPDIVWCAAGMSTPELFIDMEMDSMRRQMDVNFYGTAEMSHAILREWLAPDAPDGDAPRHLIMTSSVINFMPIPGYVPYLPSKHAVRGLAEGLSREVMMYPQNVNVHLFVPGTILSPGLVRENLTKPAITTQLEESDPKDTPEAVAAGAIRGLEKGHFLIVANWLNWLMKCGSLGSVCPNSYLEALVSCIMMLIVWPIVNFDIHGQIKKYGRINGHPSTYSKPNI